MQDVQLTYIGGLYMIMLLVIGVISFLFAMAFFFFPDELKNISEKGNRIMFTDERAIIFRKKAGVILLIVSVIFFIMGYVTKS